MRQKRPAIMVLGTASHVGKSVIAAGLCRWLRRRGEEVAPFKAQNMSLNSFVTPDGGEIGWAQAVQAAACRRVPEREFNPVLLKPVSSSGSQVIVRGQVWRTVEAKQYYNLVSDLWPHVCSSYRYVEGSCDRVVLEGAGSAAEINLAQRDIVNCRMARQADASAILVADIERGGVFASVIGTLSLMEPEDRDRVRWIVVNKFAGDLSLFDDGVRLLEERTGKRVLGVLPVYPQMRLPEEDSLALQERPEADFAAGRLKIAVVALPHMANFTDFMDLEREPGVSLRYLRTPGRLGTADVVIIPGTKTTLADLHWLKAEGWFSALQQFPGEVIGICGGFQMLGTRLSDPDGHDGVSGTLAGLGLLPAETTMASEKTLRRTKLQSLLPGLDAEADVYEIHAGETEVSAGTPAFSAQGRAEGCSVQSGRVWGTYAHGLFTSAEFLRAWLLSRYKSANIDAVPLSESASDRFDEWADFLDEHLKLDLLLR